MKTLATDFSQAFLENLTRAYESHDCTRYTQDECGVCERYSRFLETYYQEEL